MYLLLASVLSASTLAQVASDEHAQVCSTIKVVSPQFNHYSFISPVFYLVWVKPAKFPNPETKESWPLDTLLECDDFSVIATKNSVTMKTKSFQAAEKALPNIVLSGISGYTNPTLRTGRYEQRITLSLLPKLQVSGVVPFDTTVGYKVNGGVLQPLVFESKIHPLVYQEGDTVEVFVKESNTASVRYVRVDTAKQELYMEGVHDFPTN